MSDITAKNYNGLMEAYASIYIKPEQIIQEQVQEEICFEDLEVDNDLLVDIIAERLIVEEYANTEDEALNMIPHMSDAWLDNVVGNFVLEESFIDAVNSLLEEGYDLSSYTVDELYEDYIGHFNNYLNEDYNMSLHEALPLVAAPLLANPATAAAMAGLGAAGIYAGKKALDNIRKLRTGTDPASQRWLETGSYASKKESPKTKRDSAEQRRQKAAERLLQRQKAKQQQPAPSKPAAGGAPPAGPTPPEPPKGPGPLEKAKRLFKQGLGLQPGQSMTKELGKTGIRKTGEVVKATPGATKTLFTSRKPAVRALKTLGVAELGATAGRMGKSPTGEIVKGAGTAIEKTGEAISGAPKEVEAIKKAGEAYKKAKEEKPKKPQSLPGFE